MYKKLSLLILLIIPCWSKAQSLSGFQLNADASHLIYLENNDHLFLKSVESNSEPVLLDSGLAQSENTILRSWNRSGEVFIYEKGGDFYLYSVASGTTDQIDLPENFGLFRYYRINQVAVADDALYFSAQNRDTDKNFSLYRLDLKARGAMKLLEVDGDVANMTLSSDGQWLAFTSYQFYNEQYHNQLHLLNLEDDSEMVSSPTMDNTFYSNLSFSNDGRISLRNMDGSAYVATYHSDSKELNIEGLSLRNGLYLLGFEGDHYKVLSLDASGKTYSILDESLNTLSELRGSGNLQLLSYINGDFFFTEESGVSPKSLLRYNPNQGDKDLIVSFVAENPLADNQYEILTYQDMKGKDRQAFLYYPDDFEGGEFPTILMNYGGYGDRYPDMGYFLNQLVFPLLEEGFGIMLLNTRGVNSERLGEGYGAYQLEDTKALIDQFDGKIPVDFNRLIPVGHSHGATMVYYYMTHSDLFPGGIAINGAADWVEQAKLQRMTGLPGEMGGTPEEKPELYRSASPLEQISSELNPMLIFSGGKDTQIPYDINALPFAKKAKSMGLNLDYIHFEHQGHLIDDKDNLLRMSNEIREFLAQWKD